MVPALRGPGPLGRGDGASPDAPSFLIANTPGALGRDDWADPDHAAYECRLKLPGLSILSLLDADHTHVEPHLPAPHIPKHKKKDKLPPETEGQFDDPPWLKIACGEEAKHIVEEPTLEKNNATILEYLKTAPGLAKIEYTYNVKDKKGKKTTVHTGKMMSQVDETPWCGCFVMWCLMKAQIEVKGRALARDWLKVTPCTEEPKDAPRVGSIVVMSHPKSAKIKDTTTSGYHVAFFLGGPPDRPVLLGGNQGNSVCRKQFGGHWTPEMYLWPPAPKAPGHAKKTHKHK